MPGLFAAKLLCSCRAGGVSAHWFRPGASWQSVFSDSTCGMWSASPSGRSLSRLIRWGIPSHVFSPACALSASASGPFAAAAAWHDDPDPAGAGAVFGILSVYGRQGWLASLLPRARLATGSSRPTVCRASCWRVFSIADGDPPAARRWRNIPASSGKCRQAWRARLCLLPPRRMAVAAPAHSRRRRADFLCSASPASSPCSRWVAARKPPTIELAIYQALSFDMIRRGAVVLALIQMFCCAGWCCQPASE